MTRLKTEWIRTIEEAASSWNDILKQKTGVGYIELAACISGNSVENIKAAVSEYKTAVVPVTSGEGVITDFAESVTAITAAMGFNSFVTDKTDVDGIYEAYMKSADIIYMADDNRYIAVNTKTGRISDNNKATAYGFAELLCLMAGEIKNKKTAVLGYGIIGRLMAEYLRNKGAVVYVYEQNDDLKGKIISDGYFCIENIRELKQFKYIADATNTGGWLGSDMLASDVLISAPGIPLSLDVQAAEQLKARYIHDLLEIGTAVMAGMAV